MFCLRCDADNPLDRSSVNGVDDEDNVKQRLLRS